MKDRIKENGIAYELVVVLNYIPVMTLPDARESVLLENMAGCNCKYLKEYNPMMFNDLVSNSGSALNISRRFECKRAKNKLQFVIGQYSKRKNVTDELKEHDQMRVRAMNNIILIGQKRL